MYNSNDEERNYKPLEEIVLIHRGNKLKVNLRFGRHFKCNVYKTKKYQIKNCTEFQLKNNSYSLYNKEMIDNIFLKFTKLRENDEFSYILKLSCNALNITEKTFSNDVGTWQYLASKIHSNESLLDIMVNIDVVPNIHSYPTLYDDVEWTDFELRGDDGSVKMHKSVLAACSPVMKSMLSGTWREMSEGHVEVLGTSQKTLQMLKDYMYLHTLPNSGLESLMLLASYYMIPDLEQKCADKLIEQMSAENCWDVFEFAVQNKLTNLFVSLLESIDPNIVKEMREQFLKGKLSNEKQDKENISDRKRKGRRAKFAEDASDETDFTATSYKLIRIEP